LAAGQTNHHTIAVVDHLVVDNRFCRSLGDARLELAPITHIRILPRSATHDDQRIPVFNEPRSSMPDRRTWVRNGRGMLGRWYSTNHDRNRHTDVFASLSGTCKDDPGFLRSPRPQWTD